MVQDRTKERVYLWCYKNGGKFLWIIIAVSVLLTLALGTIGFGRVFDDDLPFSTRLYLSLQLFTLESGAVTDSAQIGWQLQIARWTAVVAAFGTLTNALIALFSKQIHSLFLSSLSGHVVIVGGGNGGAQLAMDLLKAGWSVVVVEKESKAKKMLLLSQMGVAECFGDATNPIVLQSVAVSKADMVVVLAGDDSVNILIANSIRIACEDATAGQPVKAFIDVSDPRLFSVACPDTESVDFSRFSRTDNSARALFNSRPLDGEGISMGESTQVHLVIIGYNPMAESLVNQALAMMHFANQLPGTLTVIADGAMHKKQRLMCCVPEFDACGEINYRDGDVTDPEPRRLLQEAFSDPNQLVTVAICDSNFKRLLADCLDIAPLMLQSRSRIFLQANNDDGTGFNVNFKEFPDLQVELFGQTETACSAEYVIGEELDSLARQIHNNYVAKRLAEGDSPEDFPALRPWHRLSTELKIMNRQQADHISTKLRSLNIRMVKQPSPRSQWPRQITSDEIEALAKAEHNRWAACKRLAGWRFGENRDNSLRIHPDLVPWSDLSDTIRDYDRDPVRQLPELLGALGYELICI